MATKRRKTMGTVNCQTPSCGRAIPVQESDTGTVNYSCPYCGAVRHAPGGSKAKRVLLGDPSFKAEDDDSTPSPNSPPTNTPTPTTPPVPVKKRHPLFG